MSENLPTLSTVGLWDAAASSSSPPSTLDVIEDAVETSVLTSVPTSVPTSNDRLDRGDVEVVIYHERCIDGFGAAFAAWLYLSNRYATTGPAPPDKTLYIGSSPYKSFPSEVEGKNVVMVDLCYKLPVMTEMLTKVKSLLVLDHHKSSEEAMASLPASIQNFDTSKSGAMLSWEYFHPTTPAPLLIQYIQDRDLWTKKLPFTDEFASMSQMWPQTFDHYLQYLDGQRLLAEMTTKGDAYRELVEKYVTESSDRAVVKFMEIDKRFFLVAHVNETGSYNSDVGNRMLLTKPYADFAVTFKVHAGGTAMSLRSDSTRADVSLIATKFGGGGHRNASGCAVNYPANSLPGHVVDGTGRVYHSLSNVYFGEIAIPANDDNLPNLPTTLPVVYLNACHDRWRIGTYLLQDTDTGLQQVQFLMSKTDLVKGDDRIFPRQALAALWYFDGQYTRFQIVWSPVFTIEQKQQFNALFGNGDLVYDGLRSTIDLNIPRVPSTTEAST